MNVSIPAASVGDAGTPPDNVSYIGTSPPYEVNEAFNQYFDEECGDVVLRDAAFSASRILYEFEPLTYKTYLEEWCQEQQDKFKNTIIDKFPTPIAYNFHRLEYGAQNVNQQLDVLRDIWESLIFFLDALVIGDFRAAGVPMDDTKIKPEHLLSNSLYTKLSIIRQLLALAATKGGGLISANLVPPDVVDDLIQLNKVRNGFYHTAAKSEEQARRLLALHYDEVFSVLQRFNGMKDVALLRFTNMSITKAAAKLRCEEFVGASLNRTIRSRSIDLPLLSRASACLNPDTLIVQISDVIFSVSPFLHFREQETGQRTYLCYFKHEGEKEKRDMFYFELVGEAVETEFPAVVFKEELDELKALLPDLSGKSGGKS